MRETPQVFNYIIYFQYKIVYMKMNTNFILINYLNYINYVKMSSTWGKSAWFIKYLNNIKIIKFNYKSSETTRNAFYSIFTKKNSLQETFYKWFVGFIDGDGSFSFHKTSKGYWTFYFKVSQNVNNIQVLYFIKNILGVGSINTTTITHNNIVEFRIRDKQHIIKYIIPIFDKYKLLTSKEFNYLNFRKAILISENNNISIEEKDSIIITLKNEIIPKDYISSAWDFTSIDTITLSIINIIISKEWIVGFTEAEGSFYLIKKGPNRIVHIFEITQKKDKIVIKAISILLSIKIYVKKTHYSCVTTNLGNIEFIIRYFDNTIKGIKSLEYRIWSRSFKKKTSYTDLVNIQNKIRKIWIGSCSIFK
uniref:LAGLIDADG homing endonuclease n=1 Tax=Malassezia vespertilionis TaxID=2020962 RepID=UPI003002EE87|nr:LAGLIDADG homing endonuclease [Malassezia vespertilionis]